MAIIPVSTVLRNIPQTVNYTSTAEALVELSAFPSSSPILSASIEMAAMESPSFPVLVSLLASEADSDPRYLSNLSPAAHTALEQTDSEVQQRLEQIFALPTIQERPQLTSGTTTPTTATVPPIASEALDSLVPLLDQYGQTACQNHAIAQATCLEAPLPSMHQYLDMTNWSQSWQLVYKTTDLQSPGGVANPVAILPPAVNAPFTISGAVATAVQTIASPVLNDNICQQAANVPDPSQNDWIQPSACTNDAVSSALLSQLTLTSQSSTVQAYVSRSSGLEKGGLTVVGALGPRVTAPNTLLGFQEILAGEVSLGITMISQVVVPIAQIVLDQVISNISQSDTADEATASVETSTEVSQSESSVAKLEASEADAGTNLAGDLTLSPSLSESSVFASMGKETKAEASQMVTVEESDLTTDSKRAESEWALRPQAAGASALSAVVDGFLGQGNYVSAIDSSLISGQPLSTLSFLKTSLVTTLSVLDHISYLLPVLFPAFFNNASLMGIFSGAAFSYSLPLIPFVGEVAGGVVDTIDQAVGLVADTQNLIGLGESIGTGDMVHSYAPLDELRQTGSTSVAPLYQLVVPRSLYQVLNSRLTATAVIGQDQGSGATYTLDPASQVVNDIVGVGNVTQLNELHLAASGTAAISTPAYLGPIQFSVMTARLPVGQGPVSFALPSATSRDVTIAYEGNGTHLVTVQGTITNSIALSSDGHSGIVAFRISAPSVTSSTMPSLEGGFVFAATGPAAGQLVGLIEMTSGRLLTAVTGLGARYLFCQAEPTLCVQS
ncbi:hypothetical protein [Ferrimicrobium sp.]|uniref:hypothetical protein n=1 Tax=Ferrimicrobium sp. TaxID=2926050 RepID=UPI0026138CE6|nr:hypothetical protein [Ferrimicrobium sp.]